MYVLLQGFLLSLTVLAYHEDGDFKGEFPKSPIEKLTPGSLCHRPNAYRYPEKIPYCNRDVDSATKREIFKVYRNEGYRLNPKERSRYKIDHLIPLCAGGSNNEDNLWPQHITVYTITDSLEGIGCEKLKIGRIKQLELVNLILDAKHDLSLVPRTLKYLNSI